MLNIGKLIKESESLIFIEILKDRDAETERSQQAAKYKKVEPLRQSGAEQNRQQRLEKRENT